jgi:hypothetical protein
MLDISRLMMLAQDDGGGGGGLVLILGLLIMVLIFVGCWKVFTKAGKPGWAIIIPIYNGIVLLQIVGRPVWWILLYLIPIVNIIVGIIVSIDLAKSFGKGAGYGLGLVFLGFIFFPMLGLGSAKYQGPAAATSAA